MVLATAPEREIVALRVGCVELNDHQVRGSVGSCESSRNQAQLLEAQRSWQLLVASEDPRRIQPPGALAARRGVLGLPPRYGCASKRSRQPSWGSAPKTLPSKGLEVRLKEASHPQMQSLEPKWLRTIRVIC